MLLGRLLLMLLNLAIIVIIVIMVMIFLYVVEIIAIFVGADIELRKEIALHAVLWMHFGCRFFGGRHLLLFLYLALLTCSTSSRFLGWC